MNYSSYFRDLDVDSFERDIGFEPTEQKPNKAGHIMDLGFCPDPWHLHKHGDTTGKFAINRERRTYMCWVCGSGSLLDLYMAIRAIPEDEAQEQLFSYTAPVEKADTDFLSEIDAILWAEERAKPVMPYYNERVLDQWADLAPVEGWLRDRGVSLETAGVARVGYQADAARMAPRRAERAREEPYQGPAVYLPHFWGERLIGWQQRWLDDDRPRWISKYTNTGGFPKAETIYGYEQVYLSERPIIVCESVMTVLFLRSIGYPAVATFGGSVTEEQMRLLRLCHQGLVLAPDNDGPGRKWLDYTPEEILKRKTDRVILAKYLASYVPVKVIEPVGAYGSGNDLGDLIDEGLPFAREAVRVLYEEAAYC